METVREGIRAGALEKDVFDRLVCAGCDRALKRRANANGLGSVRYCANCGAEWQEIR